MKRRQFIGSVAVLGLAAGCNIKHLTAGGAKPRVQWSMGQILWRNNGGARRITLQETVKDLYDLGLDGIEYSPRKGELESSGLTRESFRDLLKDNRLSLSGHYFGGITRDPGQRKQILDSFRGTLDSLKFYHSKNIILGPPKRVGQESHEETIRRSAPIINELGKIALEEGLQAGIHPHYNGTIESPDEIRLAMEVTDPQYVFLSADTGHIALGGGNVIEILRTYKDRLNYFHLKDVAGKVKRPNFGPNLRELGQGEIDFPAVMKLLNETGYKGWLNVEQDATKLTPRESAAQSMAYIKKLKSYIR